MKKRINKRIGIQIRTIRKEKNLTQAQLAEKTGISQGYIANIEAAKYNISLETLDKIAAVLDKEIRLMNR